jgi:hypothetical protein
VLLKQPSRILLPAIAGSFGLIFVYARLSTDSLENAGARFGTAIKNRDTRQLLTFLESEEITALDLDEDKLNRFLDFTLAKNYPSLDSFDLNTRESDGMLEVSLQNLESTASERLSFAFVGQPGNFRSPGFIWNLISIAAKKETPRNDVPGGLGAALAMADYMLAKQQQLKNIGIPALYDSNTKALVTFQTRARLIYSKFEEAKTNSKKP